jgi:hypothetical protein
VASEIPHTRDIASARGTDHLAQVSRASWEKIKAKFLESLDSIPYVAHPGKLHRTQDKHSMKRISTPVSEKTSSRQLGAQP